MGSSFSRRRGASHLLRHGVSGYMLQQKRGSSSFSTVPPTLPPTVPPTGVVPPRGVVPPTGVVYYDTKKPTKDCKDFEAYYEKNLRKMVQECYLSMTPPEGGDKSYLIGREHLVSAHLRFPRGFNDYFFKQAIIKARVVVVDPKVPYPSWMKKGRKPQILRNPIQIITPVHPPREFCCLYTDGSPNDIPGRLGGGGLILVDEYGGMRSFRVAVKKGTALETEAYVLLTGLKLLVSEGIRKVIIRSDSKELMEGLTGSRYIDDSLHKIMREIDQLLLNFKEKIFEYTPREALAAVDAIAREVRSEIDYCEDEKVIPTYTVGEVSELEYSRVPPELMDWLEYFDRRPPCFRLTPFHPNQLKHKSPDELKNMSRFCPEK